MDGKQSPRARLWEDGGGPLANLSVSLSSTQSSLTSHLSFIFPPSSQSLID